MHRKPQVPGIEFSLSHVRDTCLVAVGRIRMGVDVEQPIEGPVAPQLAKRIFSAEELRRWAALSSVERSKGLARAWTIKEAYGKALGTGLTPQVEKGSVPLAPWRVHVVELRSDLVATLVAERSDWSVVVKSRRLALC
jgi:4'-phosphopantetheinyl transferase